MKWELCGFELQSELLLKAKFSWHTVRQEYLISKSSQAVNLEASSKPEFVFHWSLYGSKRLGQCPLTGYRQYRAIAGKKKKAGKLTHPFQ